MFVLYLIITIYRQEREEAALRERHQQEREAFKVHRMQRNQQKHRPKSLRLTSSPGGHTSGPTSTSPPLHTDDTQMKNCKVPVVTSVDSSVLADQSGEAAKAEMSSSKKGRTISEDMLELVQNLGAPRPVARPPAGKMTLNQIMEQQQKATGVMPGFGQRPVYPAVGIATASYHGQYFPTFHTFPFPYQRLPDDSVVPVSQVDDGSATTSTSSSSSNIQQQQQQQPPPQQSSAATSAWVQWQQQ